MTIEYSHIVRDIGELIKEMEVFLNTLHMSYKKRPEFRTEALIYQVRTMRDELIAELN